MTPPTKHIICRTCNQPFNKKTIKQGYIDQCDKCSVHQSEPDRYIGVHNGESKSASINIIRTDLINAHGYLGNSQKISFGFNSVIGQQTKEERKKEPKPEDQPISYNKVKGGE